uniref:DDE Tnp4 domain-containing protein n=1 Tax=Lactuca sativa TaxID=4236 RepID=A0A9R1UIX7_LACSA|nr:hypothetical protein LSAT_V11C900492920 [Lactuca sativa]
MIVCDFNICFTFVWAGWEGTAHGTRIFNEALHRPDLHFPFPTDKYYVIDVRYPNTRGYLAPYKGTNIRYHISDFRRGHTAAMREPRGPKEKFNYYHSSLFDETFNRAQQKSYNLTHNRTSSKGDEEGPSTHRMSNDNSYMTTIRDIIAQDIMEFRR